MASQNNIALVFGASGISGWALAKNLLSYPTATTFSRVIGLTMRPLKVEDSSLPLDPRLELISGINLRLSLEEVKALMEEMIPGLETVTHVYYTAYSNATKYAEKVMEIKEINVLMTGNAVHAVDTLCPNLKFLVLQTGTNHYGVACLDHIDNIKLELPLKESNPRVPSPYGDSIFYYPQVDLIREASRGKSWSWCEVRPDQIIGFVPHHTIMTTAEPLAVYLSLYRYINGPGATIAFLGNQKTWSCTFTHSSQDIISRSEIFLSLKPEQSSEEAYNIADSAKAESWSEKWPKVTAWFGLKGVGPEQERVKLPGEWFKEHAEDYRMMLQKYGLNERLILDAAWSFLMTAFLALDRSRELDLTKIRKLGFKEELECGEGHYIAFERMAEAGIIPSRAVMQQQ